MDVDFIDHARERMQTRGASLEEVRQTILEGAPVPAKAGREATERVFPYNGTWQGRRYQQKKVRAVYVREGDRAVVITVFVYYGSWGDA